MGDENGQAGETTREDPAPPGGDGGQPGAPPGAGQGGEQDPKTYDEAYVKQLREEAAAHRVKAKRADDAEDRLRTLAVAAACTGVLTDPTDLSWSDDMADDDGWPDPDKIRTVAEALVAAKPHLGRPAGDVGQGRHTETDDAVSLSSLLRAGA